MPFYLCKMTSSNGNIFRVTGHLCGEFTGPGEFPTQRPVTRGFDVFFDLHPNKRLSKQWWGWWFETLSCPLWRHRNGLLIPADDVGDWLGSRPLWGVLHSLGNWPVLYANWNDTGLDMEQLMTNISLMGIDGIVTFEVTANRTMSSQNVLRVMPIDTKSEAKIISDLWTSQVTSHTWEELRHGVVGCVRTTGHGCVRTSPTERQA